MKKFVHTAVEKKVRDALPDDYKTELRKTIIDEDADEIFDHIIKRSPVVEKIWSDITRDMHEEHPTEGKLDEIIALIADHQLGTIDLHEADRKIGKLREEIVALFPNEKNREGWAKVIDEFIEDLFAKAARRVAHASRDYRDAQYSGYKGRE